jgi:hypothetical protein
MKQTLLAAALAATLAAATAPALAGGAYFSRAAEAPSSRVQQAYLIHFDGWETLCLQSDYRGPTEDFAWVIPVPSQPEVSLSESGTLTALEKKTRPTVIVSNSRKPSSSRGCAAPGGPIQGQPSELSVAVLQSMTIGKLDAEVLQPRPAANGQVPGGAALLAWLESHGYKVPQSATPILQDYIDRGFFFVAIKFSRAEIWKGAPADVKVGEFPGVAVQLRFQTDRPFYPLAISAVDAAAEEEILLFTVAQHRLAPVNMPAVELGNLADLATVTAAQKGKTPAELLRMEIARQLPSGFVIESAIPTPCEVDQDGRASMGPIMSGRWGRHLKSAHLTRFHAVLHAGQMRSDLYFASAPTDNRYDGTIRIFLGAVSAGGGGAAPTLALAALVALMAPFGWRRAGRRARPILLAAALVLLALA